MDTWTPPAGDDPGARLRSLFLTPSRSWTSPSRSPPSIPTRPAEARALSRPGTGARRRQGGRARLRVRRDVRARRGPSRGPLPPVRPRRPRSVHRHARRHDRLPRRERPVLRLDPGPAGRNRHSPGAREAPREDVALRDDHDPGDLPRADDPADVAAEAWAPLLPPSRRARAEELQAERRRGASRDLLDCIQLADKASLLTRRPEFLAGPASARRGRPTTPSSGSRPFETASRTSRRASSLPTGSWSSSSRSPWTASRSPPEGGYPRARSERSPRVVSLRDQLEERANPSSNSSIGEDGRF